MRAHIWIWVAMGFTWALIIVNAIRLSLIRKYPLVFCMVFASMAGGLVMYWLALEAGVSNMTYAWCWVVKELVTESLTAAVLLQIYSLPEKISFRKDWHLSVAFGFASLAFLDERQIWLFARLCSAAKLAVTYLGIVTILRIANRRDFRLGWNLKTVLVAVTVPAVFSHLIMSSYVMGLLSPETGEVWAAWVGLATWIILAVGMLEYSPPGLVSGYGPNGALTGLEDEAPSNGSIGRKATREDACITPSCFF